MSETISACENVCSDFAWLSGLGGFVANSAPVIALIGALILFSWQKNRERQDELRRERQQIYRDYLSAIRNREKIGKDAQLIGDDFQMMNAALPHHELLTVVAPDSVVSASLKYMNVFLASDFSKIEKPQPGVKMSADELAKFMAQTNEIKNGRLNLIREMRIDVLKGTKISEKLTPVEELV